MPRAGSAKFQHYAAAATCTTKASAGTTIRVIISGCTSNVLTGAVTLLDNTTNVMVWNAGTASGSYTVGAYHGTSIKLTIASAGDRATVVYL